ncbi:MAG: translocation/assembly module TamB domain-containing protein, partial [Paludibacteraceae bacterium]|nr:translocation/assembly module TamB domain-containing protein [Paludibacteraceae bacterium]
MEDQRKDTMIYADKAVAGFDLLCLITDSRLLVTDVALDGAQFHLKKQKDGQLNLRFLIDAFKRDKKKKQSRMSYQVNRLTLKNSSFTYDDERKPRKDGKMDYFHLDFRGISGDIRLNEYRKGFLDVEVRSLACVEKGGLKVDDLKGKLVADTAEAKVTNFVLKMPSSEVHLDSVCANYDETWVKKVVRDAYGNEKVKESLDWKNVLLEFALDNSVVGLKDLGFVLPRLGGLSDKVELSAHFKGTFGNMHLYNLNFDCNEGGVWGRLSVDFAGLPDLNETYAYVGIKELGTTMPMLSDLIAKLTGKPFKMPEQLNGLGKVKYRGSVSGYLTDLVAYGELISDIGLVSMDMHLDTDDKFKSVKYNGEMGANNLNLAKLLGEKSMLGQTSFKFKSTGAWTKKDGFTCGLKGDIAKLTYKAYEYKNIHIDGYVKGHEFDGQIDVDDENADIDFSGNFNYSKSLQTGAFSLNINNLQPHNLNLVKGNEELSLSGIMSFDFRGDIKSNNHRADIYVNNFTVNNGERKLRLNDIEVVSVVTPTRDSIVMTSELMSMKVSGDYQLTTLAQSMKNAGKKYLPVLFAKEKKKADAVKCSNEFDIKIDNININKLSEVLGSNVRLGKGAYVTGHFSDKTGKFNAKAEIPVLKFGKKTKSVDSTLILLDNEYDIASLRLQTKYNGHTGLGLMANASHDSVQINVNWDNPSLSYGSLNIEGLLHREMRGDTLSSLLASIDVMPTFISINDDQWHMRRSHIDTDFKSFNVKGFEMDHDKQYVRIDGMASKNMSDSIDVDLKGVHLAYIMDLVGVNAVDLDAMINGKACVYGLLGPMVLNIDATADAFSFNNSVWGDVSLKSEWDSQTRRLHAKGYVFNSSADKYSGEDDSDGFLADIIASGKRDTSVVIEGEYFPKNDSLEFLADVSTLKLDFIQKYLDGIMSDVTGDASGKLRIFGSLKRILMEGDIMVNNGQLKVDFLNTTYHFSDTVKIRQDKFAFDNIDVRDAENHSALLNGEVIHDYYKNIVYNISILPRNMLAMDLKASDGQNFYGKAYATGNVRIFGYPGAANFTIQARTEPNTKVFLSLGNGSTVTENNFITYVDRDAVEDSVYEDDDIIEPKKAETRMKVSLTVEATPDAEVNILTSAEGDMLKATGTGNVRMEYDSKSDLQLFGNYEVEKGSYIFTLQNIIRRDFTLRNGGTIKWSGDPREGIINLDALYLVQGASLLDILDEADLEGLGRTTVPVNCLLNLTGNLMQPNIKFDLELPSDNELQRKVKNIVNTDEMMNREILSLLVIGAFYRPEYIQNSSSTNVG